MKYAGLLKEIFINLISISSYPAVTMMDIAAFASKAKLFEGSFQMQDIDRLFISANF